MLNYHFGSRDQLLAAVIGRVCEAEGQAMEDCLARTHDPVEAGRVYWHHVAETARAFAPCSTSCPHTRCTASPTPSSRGTR